MATEPLEIGQDKTLLLVDDDEPFLKRRLSREFSKEDTGDLSLIHI